MNYNTDGMNATQIAYIAAQQAKIDQLQIARSQATTVYQRLDLDDLEMAIEMDTSRVFDM